MVIYDAEELKNPEKEFIILFEFIKYIGFCLFNYLLIIT